ncbi:MAG: GNAT family N-acetyltransferase [Nanoarchaeota archaeon]|nr:GNAT family N-acetyltransferase [Nanoarchaeota archaeon]
MKIKLKEYRIKYFPTIFLESLRGDSLKNIGFLDKEHMAENLKFWVSKKQSYRFVILMGKKMVGSIGLTEVESTNNFSLGIFVFKKYWNMGIATASIKDILKVAKKLNIKKISAETYLDNYSIEKVFRRTGFRNIKHDKKNNYWEKKL